MPHKPQDASVSDRIPSPCPCRHTPSQVTSYRPKILRKWERALHIVCKDVMYRFQWALNFSWTSSRTTVLLEGHFNDLDTAYTLTTELIALHELFRVAHTQTTLASMYFCCIPVEESPDNAHVVKRNNSCFEWLRELEVRNSMFLWMRRGKIPYFDDVHLPKMERAGQKQWARYSQIVSEVASPGDGVGWLCRQAPFRTSEVGIPWNHRVKK